MGVEESVEVVLRERPAAKKSRAEMLRSGPMEARRGREERESEEGETEGEGLERPSSRS